jgi:uncharacterized protein
MPRVEEHQPGTPCWVDMQATDMEAASRFYTALFGWDPVDMPMPDGQGVYRMFQKDGADVAGIGQQPAQMAAQGIPSVWTVYVAGDADAAAEATRAAGGSVLMDPADVGSSGRMAVLADPGQAALGVWQAGDHHGAGLLGEPGAMAWSEVNTRDYDTCRAFYPRLFGWQPEDLPMEASRYTIWKLDGEMVAGMLEMTADWEGVPPHWMVYFAVEDTDATAAKATELGGSVGAPPFDTPYGRVAVLVDPTGGHFSVVQPPPPGAS